MFYLDGISLSKIKKELKEEILNKKIGKIFQNSSLSLTLHFGKLQLFFSCNPSFPICYINQDKEENFLEETSNFLLLLRKHLVNAALVDIEQLGYDRILKFVFTKVNELGEMKRNYLYFEIMGKHSNIILAGEDNRIIGVIKRKSLEENNIRTLFTGEEYTQPIVTEKINPEKITREEFEKFQEEGKLLENIEGVGKLLLNEINSYGDLQSHINSNERGRIYLKNNNPILATVLNIKPKDYNEEEEYLSYNSMINAYIKMKSFSNSYTLLKNKLNSIVEKEIKKSTKILKNIEKDIVLMGEHEEIKNKGDILASVLYNIKKGDIKVAAYDFYKNEEIELPLDPLLTPQKNLEKIYKKSSKMKRGLEHSKNRLVEFSNKIFYFESVLSFIENSKTIDDLKGIQDELVDGGYAKKTDKKKNKKKIEVSLYGLEEVQGKTIYYGRNNKENDFLTFKFAKKDDIWFHIKDIPGSHLIIKKEDFVESEELIQKIGELAAYYSKANTGDKVTIDYTEKKNLNKPKGAPLGLVTYNIWKSVIVVTPKK